MRKYNKNQCKDLIKTLEEAHGEIAEFISKNKIETAASFLEQCQQAAIAIGDIVESSEGEGTAAVSRLEAYCELTYNIHEELVSGAKVNSTQIEKKLKKVIRSARNNINALPTQYEAVFLPYKASMWDSLESIWMAADEDPNCDAYVVPIPYYDRNKDGSFKEIHYEGAMYPREVPITHYSNYNIEERHPEIIYIHNPYDDWNYVTSIHPDYYSDKLKQYTDCLVYVPYYATSGMMSEGQSMCPAYLNANYIVVQSKEIIEQYDKSIPREKFLPIGSPKFDRVIRLCMNPPEPPTEWKEKLEGKQVFFYNTSIGGFLGETEQFIKKMKYVFETFKGRKDVCLIWRPHPLLESTIDSMRPEVKKVYESLKNEFILEDIGILDETPDIDKTIALSNAYIGDTGSSVVSLFGVAGKPIFILNNHLHEKPGEDDWMAWVSQSLRSDGNNRYCITMGNRLFEDKDGNYNYRYICNLSDEFEGGSYYSRALEIGNQIVVFPENVEHILIIDPITYQKKEIQLKHELARGGVFAGIIWFFYEEADKCWLIPNKYSSLVRLDVLKHKVTYYKDEAFTDAYSIYEDQAQRRIISARWVYGTKQCYYEEGKPRIEECSEEDMKVPGFSKGGRRLFCLNTSGTRLRAINLDNGDVEERKLEWNILFTAMMRFRENLDVMWFLPYEGTVLGKWTLSEDKWETVDVGIDGLYSVSRPNGLKCNVFYFSNGIYVDGKLILAPLWGNKFVEFDTITNVSKEWLPPFDFSTENKNDYWYNGAIGHFIQNSRTLDYYFYYAPEHRTFFLDPRTKEYHDVNVSFNRDEIFGLAQGFHKESKWLPYCCFEDVFNSLEDIVDSNVKGGSFDCNRQIEAFTSVNASSNGESGKELHRTILETMKR